MIRFVLKILLLLSFWPSAVGAVGVIIVVTDEAQALTLEDNCLDNNTQGLPLDMSESKLESLLQNDADARAVYDWALEVYDSPEAAATYLETVLETDDELAAQHAASMVDAYEAQGGKYAELDVRAAAGCQQGSGSLLLLAAFLPIFLRRRRFTPKS